VAFATIEQGQKAMPTTVNENLLKAPQPRPKGSGGGPGAPSHPATPGQFLRKPFVWFFLCLLGLMVLLFHSSFDPDKVHFSNDAPLGAYTSEWESVPSGAAGIWDDLNSIGFNPGGSYAVGISFLLRSVLGPLWYSKVFPPLTLLFIGSCAWLFFRCLKLSPAACAVGGLAVALNSGFLSATCWGVGTIIIAFGAAYLALAAIVSSPNRNLWLKLALAGFAVGIGVIEGLDNGAIFSMLVSAFVVFYTFTEEGSPAVNVAKGVGKVAVIAIFAALISIQAVVGLVSTQIKGVAGNEQDIQSKAEHWSWATQWSLPKNETLSLIVPGLFGYRMDTPNGGNYWGLMGMDPVWDSYFASGKTTPRPDPNQRILRFTGGNGYLGVTVALVALWAALQVLRGKNSVFEPRQRKLIGFWSIVAFVSLLLAYGRFAPFYRFLYQLPYFSSIRNPAKFVSVLSFSVMVLFAYGVHGLWQRYIAVPESVVRERFGTWWAKTKGFDKRWVIGCGAVFVLSLIAWKIYAGSEESLVTYLEGVQFEDPALARNIADFSIHQVGWFVLFFLFTGTLMTLILAGKFAGRRAKWAGVLLGLLVVVDLARANLPWILYVDYKQKYATNDVLELLKEKPYEHRVAFLPFRSPPELAAFDQLYRIEWAQHHFLYDNIQSLDLIQMPRMPADLKAFETALSFDGTSNTLFRIRRRWELTNTRYLLGASGFLPVLNEQLDPVQHRFRYLARFDLALKPGISHFSGRLEEITAVPKTDGQYAVFEFTGALPRANLFSQWQVMTNDAMALKELASPNFEPAQKVLVSSPLPASTTNAPSQAAGTVSYASYASKKIVLQAKASTPCVLLLNDKFDPNWKVTVDGKPETLLRCNFIMRGVRLEPGSHTVEFRFAPPAWPMYISILAVGLALCLAGVVVAGMRKPSDGN
jgi:hypothetical protein